MKPLKLYRSADVVFQTADGKEWVSCPNHSCGKRQMKHLRHNRYQCSKCRQVWILQ